MVRYWQQFHAWYKRNERLAMPSFFAFGFLLDSLTFTRADSLFANVLLTAYLFIAAAGIAIIHGNASGRNPFLRRLVPWFDFLIPFSFGSLFSSYVVLYTRSGTFSASWPFLIFLIFLFIGNELFKRGYQSLVFQLSIFFITLFAYLTFAIPLLLHAIGAKLFLLSGAVSIVLFLLLVRILRLIDKERMRKVGHPLMVSVATIFLLFNFAYFTDVIPPIPLALRHIGIYHTLIPQSGNTYTLTFEPPPWYDPFAATSEVYHRLPGENASVLSSIFAPSGVTTTIVHEWFKYDPSTETWVSKARIPFPITGGRAGGYRGYSEISTISPGTWRVDVLTLQGQVLGRMKLEVVAAVAPPPTRTVTE